MSSAEPSFPSIPLAYRLFFLYIEPISALVGAYYAAFKPTTYLDLLSPDSATSPSNTLPAPTLSSLYQLANLYLLFALNEHLVLSSTTSLRTWRTLLFCLLIADFGHLATMVPLAREKGFVEDEGVSFVLLSQPPFIFCPSSQSTLDVRSYESMVRYSANCQMA